VYKKDLHTKKFSVLKCINIKVFALVFLFFFFISSSYAVTYYSKVGQSNPNALANWTVNSDGSGANPANFTTAGDIFIVQSGHSYTTSAAWNVTGTVQVDGTLTYGTASAVGSLTVTGTGVTTANAATTISGTGTFTINSGGKYIVNHTSGNTATTFAGTESFNANSIFEYQNLTAGGFTSGITYGNFIWNANTSGSLTGSITINGSLTVKQGTFSMGYNVTVAGDLNIEGGTLVIASGSTNTLTLNGNYYQTGGTLDLNNAGTAGTLDITTGNFNQTTGTLKSTSSYGVLRFSKASGTQTYFQGGTIALPTNYVRIEKTAGGILQLNSDATWPSQITVSSGTIDFGSSTARTITMGSTSLALNFNGSTLLMNGGNLAHKLIYSNSAGAATFTGPTTYTHGTSDIFEVTAGTGTLTLGGNVAFNILSLTSGTFNPAIYNLTVSGNTNVTATLSDNSATGINSFQNVIMTGGTIAGNAVNPLFTINGNIDVTTGDGTLGRGDFAVTGMMNVGASRTLTLSSGTGTKTFNGDVTIDGIWNNSGGGAVAVNSNFAVNTGATFTAGAGVHTFGGSGKTIGGTISIITIPSVTITGTVTNNSNNLIVTTALAGGSTLTNGAGATLSLAITNANFTLTTLVANTNPNTVKYCYASANQNVRNITYHHLTIDKPSYTATLLGATTINGDINVINGTFADGGFQITGNGTGFINAASGTFFTIGTAATATVFPTNYLNANILLNTNSTVTYNSNVAQNISSVPTYGNLNLVATSSVTKTALGPIAVNGNLSIGTYNTLADGGFIITVKGNVSNGKTHSGTGRIYLSGGSGVHTITGGATYYFGNMELDDTYGASMLSDITLNGVLTLTSGALSIGAFTLTLNSTISQSAGSLTGGATSNIIYSTTAAAATILPAVALNNLTIDRTAGISLNGNVSVAGTLTFTNGSFILGSYDFTFGTAGIASGNAAGKMLITNGTGQCKKTYGTGNPAAFIYPIGENTGTTEYSPMALDFSANSFQRIIGVKVIDGNHPQFTINGPQTDYISRYWTFTDDQLGNGTYTYALTTTTFTYLAADINGTEGNIKLNRWDGASWNQSLSTAASNVLTLNAACDETTGTLGGSDFTGRVNPTGTYTWNQTGTGSWTTATNWTPTRTSPYSTDILQFNNGATTTVTNVPTQTIGQLLITGSTNVSLQSVAAVTLSINGPTATNNLQIASGSTLQLSSTGTNSINLRIVTTASQKGDISGTLVVNSNTNSDNTFTSNTVGTTVVTVGSGGAITNNGGTITSTAATLVFGAGSTYNHARDGGAIPTANFSSNPTSTCNITGITANNPTGFSGTFGNVTWNCSGQTTATGAISGALTVNGNLSVLAGTLFDNGTQIAGTNTKLLTVASGATLKLGTGTATTFPTNFITGNTSLDDNSTVNYASTNAQTISSIPSKYGHLLCTGNSTKSLAGALTVNGNLTVSAGTLDDIGYQITGNASGTLSLASNSILSLGAASATFFPTNFTTAHISLNDNSTVIYYSNVNQTISSTPATYGKLTCTRASGTPTKTPNGSIIVNSNLTIGTGNTLADGGNTVTVKGNSTNNGTHTGAGKILLTSGASSHTLAGTGSYTNLELDDATYGAICSASFAVNGTMTLTDGALIIGANTLTLNGAVAGTGTYTGSTSSNMTITGTGVIGTAYFTTGNRTLNNLTMNRPGGQNLILGTDLTVSNVLDLQNSNIITTQTNILSITNTAANSLLNGNTGSFIKGPLARSLTTTTPYTFPVGKSILRLFELVSTSVSGSVTMIVEEFDADCGGTPETRLDSIRHNRYWVATKSGAGSVTSTTVRITESPNAPLSAYNCIAKSSTVNGVYDDIGNNGCCATITSDAFNTFSYFVIGARKNMVYSSCTTTQNNTSNVAKPSNSQEIIGVEIVTAGGLFSPISAANFTLNTNGNTAPATDITNAKLYYTGASSSFATTTQVGSTVAGPNGSFVINAAQQLVLGTNYFWLTYDVPGSAINGNVLDAECNTINIGGVDRTPTVQAPSGNRPIGNYASVPYCQSFDATWVNKGGTRDVPDGFWVGTPVTGDNSWRRDDDGASVWSNTLGGSGIPFQGRSARYHSYSTSTPGYLDLYVDFTQAGNKLLSFNYFNNSGTDKIQVYFSTDGGSNFTLQSDVLSNNQNVVEARDCNNNWLKFAYNLGNSTSNQCVIRFKATGDNAAGTDIGIDNVCVNIVPASPAYATIPFTEGFETVWTDYYGYKDIPNSYWQNTPYMGENSWRRNGEGCNANWDASYDDYGQYTAGTGSYYADFHSYTTALTGKLDLYINLSPSGNKLLTFNYLNQSGTDILKVYLSTDGGNTFTQQSTILSSMQLGAETKDCNNKWIKEVYNLGTTTSSTCVIRFQATGDGGHYNDIGIDNINVDIGPADPVYATLPYTQGFETAWTNYYGYTDIPDASWRNTPYMGENSWRRNGEGCSANWDPSYDDYGQYTAATGSYYADFHSYTNSTSGKLDLYVDMSSPGFKRLSFDYKNTSGTDQLQVQFSEDGPTKSWITILTLGSGYNWETQYVDFDNTTSPTCVIRFIATGDGGHYNDIGIDNINIHTVNDIYVMDNDDETTCSGIFFDSGGSLNNYSNNENYEKTFYPNSGSIVVMQFVSFSTYNSSDHLHIYDTTLAYGPKEITGSPFYGSTSPGSVTATNGAGALTFVWTSDGSNVASGWKADVACRPGCSSNPPLGEYCMNAVPVCNLNGYCGNTTTYGPEHSPTNPIDEDNHAGVHGVWDPWTIENDGWLTFVAEATSISIDVWVSNCTDGKGIQIGVFYTDPSPSPNHCETFIRLGDVWSPAVVQNISGLIFPGLTIGNTYYMLIDGYAGDHCEYTIGQAAGMLIPDAGPDQYITLPACANLLASGAGAGGNYTWSTGQTTAGINVCPSVTTTYTVTVTGGSTNCPSSGTDQVTVYVSGTQPVTLLDYTAKCDGNEIVLEWMTASESNNDYFTIERSTDGIYWFIVDQVKGAGNANNLTKYSYTDIMINNGDVYYRLSQTDYNGNTEYLGIDKVDCKELQQDNASIISISENKDQGCINVILYTPDAEKEIIIEVYDYKGQQVLSKIVSTEEGKNIITINEFAFSSGVYLFNVIGNYYRLSEKTIIN
jgi:hypothetical protein